MARIFEGSMPIIRHHHCGLHFSQVKSSQVNKNLRKQAKSILHSSAEQINNMTDYEMCSKFRVNWGWGRCFSRKPAISLKRGRIISQGYHWWLIGSRIRSFDWYQNQRLWMTLNGHCPFYFTKTCFSEPTTKIYRSIISAANMLSNDYFLAI